MPRAGATTTAPPDIRQLADRQDNSPGNRGRRGSFTFYGQAWGSVSATPFRGHKGASYEGGIRVPAIVSGAGVGGGGRVSRGLAGVVDFVPTVLELAGVRVDGGRFSGRSLLPVLDASSDSVRGPGDAIGVEIWGHRGLRMGDWKIVNVQPPKGPGRWQLFNVREDPGETRDLAASSPDQLRRMLAAWRGYARVNNVILPDGPFRVLPPGPLPTR